MGYKIKIFRVLFFLTITTGPCWLYPLEIKNDEDVSTGNPSTTSRNLLMSASFETGAEAYALSRVSYLLGASRASDFDFQPMNFDTSEKMHGRCSVRIDNPLGDTILLSSGDLELTPGRTYTLSTWIRATGGINKFSLRLLSVENNQWQAVGGDCPVNDQWQRTSVTFSSLSNIRHYELMLGNKNEANRAQAGTVWLDGLQLLEGSSSDFAPNDFEIGLTRLTNRYYAMETNEPYRVALKAFKNNPGQSEVFFHYTVADDYFYRDVAQGRSQVFAITQGDVRELTVDLNPGRYGRFKLIYELIDGKANRILESNAFHFAVIGPVSALRNGEGFSSGGQGFFGANYYGNKWFAQPTMIADNAAADENLDFIANVGDRWFRAWDFTWGRIQSQGEDQYDWQLTDWLVDGLTKRGMRVLGSFGTWIVKKDHPTSQVPKWVIDKYGSSPSKGVMSVSVCIPPVEVWARYFSECVKRYKGKVAAWEIFNEPNLYMSPEEYAPFLKAAAQIVKRHDPAAKVVGICATGDLGGHVKKFISECFDLGAGSDMDILSFHPYDSALDSTAVTPMEAIPQIKKLLAGKTLDTMPLWNTELFYLEPSKVDQNNASFFIKGHQLARRLLLDQFYGVGVSMNLDYNYNREVMAPKANDFLHNRKPVPSTFYVINNAWARFFAGARPVKQIPLESPAKLLVYERTDGPVAAFWYGTPEKYHYAKDGNYVFDTHGLRLLLKGAQEKILCFDLMGNRMDPFLKTEDGLSLTAENSPIYLKPRGISIESFFQILEKASLMKKSER